VPVAWIAGGGVVSAYPGAGRTAAAAPPTSAAGSVVLAAGVVVVGVVVAGARGGSGARVPLDRAGALAQLTAATISAALIADCRRL
jgi:hypothetical protein